MIGQGDLVQGLYCYKPTCFDSSQSVVSASNKNCTFPKLNHVQFPVISSSSVQIPVSNTQFVNTVSNYNKIVSLWHQRMGHLSDKMLRFIAQHVSFKIDPSYSSSCCDVCPLSKLRRLSFTSNNHLSQLKFHHTL
jgi:isopenicillin N synthase-like dioxygenase